MPIFCLATFSELGVCSNPSEMRVQIDCAVIPDAICIIIVVVLSFAHASNCLFVIDVAE